MPGPGSVACPKPTTAKDKRESKRAKERDWQRVRQACLVRDDRRCRVCRRRDAVEVHHIKLRSAGREDSTANCIAICALCHSDVHGYRIALEGNGNGKITVTRQT